MIKLEVKLNSNVNGVIEETANCWNVAIITVWETLDPLSEEFSKGTLTDINKWLKQKRRCPWGGDASKKLHIKETLGDISWH